MMFKFSFLFLATIVFIFSACQSGPTTKAKKLQIFEKKEITYRQAFDVKKSGFLCDSFSVKTILKSNQIKQIIVSIENQVIDTVNVTSGKIPGGAEKDIIISDYNFDGFCDFVIPDKKSMKNGGMDHYYFLYDSEIQKFVEVKSLPKFIGNFMLDVKNQRVKIYCPDDACFAYYKYENKVFNIVQGEFKANP